MRRGSAAGFTLIEVLVALVILALVIGVYLRASVADSSAQTSLSLNQVAGKSLAVVTREINQGNPAAMHTHLTPQDIAALTDGQDRSLLTSTFSAAVTPVAGSDPPQYRVTVTDDKGNGLNATAIAPGGTP